MATPSLEIVCMIDALNSFLSLWVKPSDLNSLFYIYILCNVIFQLGRQLVFKWYQFKEFN